MVMAVALWLGPSVVTNKILVPCRAKWDKFGDISALMNANVPEVNQASHSKVLNALTRKPGSSSSFFFSFGINRIAEHDKALAVVAAQIVVGDDIDVTNKCIAIKARYHLLRLC
uniref:Uncharacterized protein n=1 Tax=Fusarium oxysporum (strain Fo5176) TaxID=660025 RepID=A0A0D2XVU9_FUSOF